MNSKFYIGLKKVSYNYNSFPDAITILNEAYNELVLLFNENQIKNNEPLTKYVIQAYNQITDEQKRIIKGIEFYSKTDLKKLTKKELNEYSINENYFHEISAITDDARAICLEYLAAYCPEMFIDTNKQKLLKELLPFSSVAKSIIESVTPEFKIEKAIEKSVEEYFFKTDNNLRKLYDTDTSEQMEFFRDKRNFQNKINSCTDATTLKAHLTETYRKWKGKKSQWIEYTLLSIAPPNSNNNVLKTSAWFEWFESHKEQENETISNDITFEVKPIFKPEMIDTIFDLLKDFFSIEQQKDFKTFIETGMNLKEKLLFLDNGNRLADAFKQLKNADFITGCNQTDLINCIEKNFNYRYRNEVKSYKIKYLESIISTNKDLCQKPIITVKANSITKNIISR